MTELISLNVTDVNADLGFIRCVGEGRERMIPIYPAAAEALKLYQKRAQRARHGPAGDGALCKCVR